MTSTRLNERHIAGNALPANSSIALELLAPAKNLECGKAAIDHGADAVYIGASRFGARAAAGNPVDDIAELCRYAHVFGAKVYVTVNTIIYEDELSHTEELVNRLYDAGADALLVQDMGLLEMRLPPIALHASTQTDNRTAAKVAWLASHGFGRVVLARELSTDEIAGIHRRVPTVELEAFVHGALCVSYSGLCYASQYCFSRSANRGECAQFCRLKFDLTDSEGNVLEHGRHLLSLKDMCRIDNLESMAEAGVTSFKIEGRLKDMSYVKNVTAAYSQKLDDIIKRSHGKYRRASSGHCRYAFTPSLDKTFNRGYTDYFIDGHDTGIASPDTPKAVGERVGRVKEIRGNMFTVAGTAAFANGDGLCFFAGRELCGFRVNRAEGNKIYPLKMPKGLQRGTELFRNSDKAFETALSGHSAERKISVGITLEDTAEGFRTTFTAENGTSVSIEKSIEKQLAEKPQRDNMQRQMAKLGNTPFACNSFSTIPEEPMTFIPSSVLAETRRQATGKLVKALLRKAAGRQDRNDIRDFDVKPENIYPEATQYNYNVANSLAKAFYKEDGHSSVTPAFELETPEKAQVMQCKHCIKRTLGRCQKHGGKPANWKEPLFLRMDDGRRFRLEFDCKNCQMNIYAE